MKEWFEEWFDTAYYYNLYYQRNENEADAFVARLVKVLEFSASARLLDVACGNGRHVLAFNQLGYDVTGIDLSYNKIRENLRFEKENLHFYRHDMRQLFRINYFDVVLNLFTSFGYFKSHYDELNAAASIAANVKYGGLFVIDYFNASYIRRNLQSEEQIESGGFLFLIHKKLEDNWISKKICVIEEDRCSIFYEKVRLYQIEDLVALFNRFGLHIYKKFGSYQLEAYQPEHSERMILVFKKHNTEND